MRELPAFPSRRPGAAGKGPWHARPLRDLPACTGRIYQFRGTGVALSGADGTDANTGQGGARDHRHTKKHTHKHKTHKTHKHTHKKHKNKHAKIHGMLDGYVVAEPNPPCDPRPPSPHPAGRPPIPPTHSVFIPLDPRYSYVF